jgi:hypothetical protein
VGDFFFLVEFSFPMDRIDADQSFTHGTERTPNPGSSKNLKGLAP